ncbi:sulfite exporter TauE/SafE family protein [Falsigemmobacter intermedius]|uniref:Probable membrane transporter protein n=1 Tax=Falsigemmobacter intermedius TaxID=1553448 RepID=A0A444MEA4_9RHOB|nr:sulfite exporter TauE/SafE family protein [Falsigemmobacter intermedius]RWY43199.1 sulfite exporter TauE/SafE family protein [Falsigemmobacter intermedius]
MDFFYGGLTAETFWIAVLVTLFAGFVKGAIGFAMPLIMMAVFASIMPPQLALAGLILSVLTTNLHQSLRDGWQAFCDSAWTYRRLIGATILGIVISAPFVVYIPARLLLGLLGLPVALFALYQLSGRPMKIALRHRNRAEYLLGLIAGLYGGLAGIWGPPVVIYLLSIAADKKETVRVQGVIFLIGGAVLAMAHLGTGVLNAVTLPFSVALVIPAFVGMLAGFRLQDRLDPVKFRRWTLILLALTALNLLRKSIFG